jgi:outer membrane biosynthesis protein TonB
MAQPAASTLTNRDDRPDPLGPVLSLGEGAVRVGAIIGLLGALALHGAAGVRAAANLFDVESFSRSVAAYVKNNLQLQIDIDTAPPPPPPPPPPAPEAAPPPEPEPQVEKAPPPSTPQPPTDAPPPPPAPAEAGKVLTDPDAPVDLTGDGFVTGNGEYRGGITSNTGTAKTAVRDVAATPGGVPGGTGTAPAPVARATEKDLSQSASPIGTSWSDCGFPAEAQLDGVEYGVVKLVVTVNTDGRAKAVTILTDPGSGFGNHARKCAMRRTFKPALDKSGQAVVSSTPPFTVRFTL